MRGSRIRRRLFGVFAALVAIAILPAAVMQGRRIARDVRAHIESSATREARVLAAEIERALPDDLSGWAHQVPAEARVTLMSGDGRVLADSEVAESALATVENHASRPEMAAALNGKVGTDARRSATVGKEFMYVAVAVNSPTIKVLRLALPLDGVADTVWRAQGAIWLGGALALVLALALSLLLARWLTASLVVMTKAARAMTHGQFDAALPEPSDDELGDLVAALDTLRQQLAARIDELRSEGEKLRTILNGMAEGVALVRDGTIVVANRSFCTLIGAAGAARDVEGHTLLESARLPELAEVIERARASHKAGERELQIGARALLVTVQPLVPAAGDQVIVIMVDMSEPRRLERLRRDFVANASHELRTPVAAILGAAETLALGAAEDPAARKSFIDIMLRHAQRLRRLTADLLDIARLEAGYRPHIEALPLASVAQQVVASLGERAEARKITLRAQLGDERATAERAAVEQILTNLIENAIKYTPEGGRVDVRSASRGQTVEVTIEDTGPGILAEHIPRLFERFYRVDDARSRELGGTGLGLSIVKHLVLAHGGDIRVESEIGRGSRFIVSLPRA